MRVRFLQTTPSEHPEFPFQPGQIIHLERLTADVKRWKREGRVELLEDDQPEAAVMGPPEEAAVSVRVKPRGTR